MKAIVRAGISPVQALYIAPSIPIYVVSRLEIGCIDINNVTDIVFLHKNHLEDIGVICELVAVIYDCFFLYQTGHSICLKLKGPTERLMDSNIK
ncbi:MAG: hypothetical protein ACTSQI_15585 [Candidatus Helarchaeota archaeon]